MIIEGRWCGEYQYDPDEQNDNEPFPFTMELHSDWFKRFTGTVNNDPLRGTLETGRVKGAVRGLTITFVKRMPDFYVDIEGKFVPLAKGVRLLYKEFLAEPVAHPDIHYAGTWNVESNKFEGIWHVNAINVPLASGTILPFPEYTGTWEMSRCPDTL